MALTRKMLKAMGIEEDQAEQIIEAHAESVDALKKQRDDAKTEAESVPELKKQLEEAQKAATSDDTAAELLEVKQKFEAYKAEVEQREARATAEKLFRDQLKAANINELYSDLAVKYANPAQYAVKGGAFTDPDAVKTAVEGFAEKFPQFIVSKKQEGAPAAHPPANAGGKTAPTSLREALHQKYAEKGN